MQSNVFVQKMPKKCKLCVFQSAEKMARGGGKRIALMSDVEGDLDYFERFVENSDIIEWGNDKKNRRTRLAFKEGCDDCHFVFAGDSQDIGIGDIRFVDFLLRFKERHEDRVHLIIGNRDCNKLRLFPELKSVEKWTIKDNILFEDGFPFWKLPDEEKSLDCWTETVEGYDEKQQLTKARFDSKTLTEKKKTYLEWAFKNTLGMPASFENRRKELKIIGRHHTFQPRDKFKQNKNGEISIYGKEIIRWEETNNTRVVRVYYKSDPEGTGSDIPVEEHIPKKLKHLLPRDEEVIESFEKECDPDCKEMYEWRDNNDQPVFCYKNFMYRYLCKGNLMIVLDKSVFCHGGLTHKNLWQIPTNFDENNQLQYGTFTPSEENGKNHIEQWSDELKKWKTTQLDEYCSKKGIVYHGGKLAAYGVAPLHGEKDLHQNSQSVLYTNMLTKLKNGVTMDDVVLRAMDSAGLSIIGTGHQPVFDCALILRTKLGSKEFFSVTVDTCKSEDKAKTWWGISNRKEDNVHEVIIQDNTIFTHGYLGNGNKKIADKNTLSFKCNTRDPLIGTSFAYKTKLEKKEEDDPDTYEDLTYWIRAELKNGDYYCVATHGWDNYPLRARKLKDSDFCPQCMNDITYNTCFELLPFDLESKQAGPEKWYLCQASNGSNVCCKDLPSVKATNSAPVSLLPALQSVQDSSGKNSQPVAQLHPELWGEIKKIVQAYPTTESDRIKNLNIELLRLLREKNSHEQSLSEETRQNISDLNYWIREKITERDAVQKEIDLMNKRKTQLLERASRPPK